jgi:hypothetical protein
MWTLQSYRDDENYKSNGCMHIWQRVCAAIFILSSRLASIRSTQSEFVENTHNFFDAQFPHAIHFDCLPN